MNVIVTPRTPPHRTILHRDIARAAIVGPLLLLYRRDDVRTPAVEVVLADCIDVGFDERSGGEP